MNSSDTSPGAITRMLSLERSMERIRWFGIALGIYQVFWYEPLPGTRVPGSAKPFATAGLALLLLLNVAVRLVLRRPRAEAALARLGVIAFLCDMAAVWTIVWAFTFEQFGSTWVLLTILSLEGAFRYRLRGALAPIAIALPVECAREVFRATAFSNFVHLSPTSYVSSLTFRIGFMLIIGFVAGVMARNLERRRAEAELRAAQLAELAERESATVERLRELDMMKSDFIAIASHELRTPLTAMQGSIKTLRRPDLPLTHDQIEEFLTILDRQSDRLTRLVEDLLIVSRIDAGGFTLRMEETTLGPLLTEIIEDLGRGASRVSLAMPPSVPAVITDRQRFSQIVRNLVENALKFSSDGSTVRLTVHYDKQTIMIEVADEGPGIPDGELPHIFERFHQVGGSMRRRSEGFGLGLYITKRLIEALGGSIEVLSEPGKGSTFRVWLPAATTQDETSEIA